MAVSAGSCGTRASIPKMETSVDAHLAWKGSQLCLVSAPVNATGAAPSEVIGKV